MSGPGGLGTQTALSSQWKISSLWDKQVVGSGNGGWGQDFLACHVSQCVKAIKGQCSCRELTLLVRCVCLHKKNREIYLNFRANFQVFYLVEELNEAESGIPNS